MSFPLRLPQLGSSRRHPLLTPEARDATIQATDTDASTSRLSAVRAGYLHDPLAAVFAPNSDAVRKYPLINRGTYVRTGAIDTLLRHFLNNTSGGIATKRQIVSLGAGSDTRFFRLRNESPNAEFVYHELDFAAVTRRKVATIQGLTVLSDLIGTDMLVDSEIGSLCSKRFNIHPLDLRSLKPGCGLLTNMNSAMPTLVLSECCLIYLDPSEADSILQWACQTFTSPEFGCVIYEPIGGDDAFGKVMIQNLASRGIALKTLKRYGTLERQKERLRIFGLGYGQRAADVEWLWEHWVDEPERRRISKLEMVDEIEEWILLARHYCVSWGWRGGGFWDNLKCPQE